MALSKTLIALGNWIESHFPEKITAAEIEGRILRIENIVGTDETRIQVQAEVIQSLIARVAELEKKSEVFVSDMNKAKIMLLSQRQTAGR